MSELNKRLITSFFLTIIILVSFSNIVFLYIIILLINFIVIDEFFKMIKKFSKKNFKIYYNVNYINLYDIFLFGNYSFYKSII